MAVLPVTVRPTTDGPLPVVEGLNSGIRQGDALARAMSGHCSPTGTLAGTFLVFIGARA